MDEDDFPKGPGDPDFYGYPGDIEGDIEQTPVDIADQPLEDIPF